MSSECADMCTFAPFVLENELNNKYVQEDAEQKKLSSCHL